MRQRLLSKYNGLRDLEANLSHELRTPIASIVLAAQTLRTASGQVLLRMVPVSLEPLVRQALHLLGPQADVKRQEVTLAIPDDLMVLADEQQVTRVITNLVHNAVKFTPDAGKIQISACAVDEEEVRLCVQDTGPGIPAAEQSRVFERFYKADRARNRGGTGLGLAIARHMVEGHGGRIWVENAPGQGTVFCFTLPRA